VISGPNAQQNVIGASQQISLNKDVNNSTGSTNDQGATNSISQQIRNVIGLLHLLKQEKGNAFKKLFLRLGTAKMYRPDPNSEAAKHLQGLAFALASKQIHDILDSVEPLQQTINVEENVVENTN
jgi:hypothetical protein